MAIAERAAVGHQSSSSAPAGRGGSPGRPPSIFVSYSHKDEALVERMLAHLLVLQTYGIARIFYDQEIQRGEKWRDRILEEIDGATVILCLLSADYLSSEFVNSDEIPRIRERQAAGIPVIPVLLRSCPWQVCDWLEERQLFTLNGKALDLGKPKEVEQRFADLTLEVFHLLAEHPDFDPPGAAQADAAEETATEPDARGAEDPKILKAKDRFRRKALLEIQVRSALERLVAERTLEVTREAVVSEAPLYVLVGLGHGMSVDRDIDSIPWELLYRGRVNLFTLWDPEAHAIRKELVVEMRLPISDHTAIGFSSTFYERLAAGDLRNEIAGNLYTSGTRLGRRDLRDFYWEAMEELSERLAGCAPPPNVWGYTQTPIRMIYTSGWYAAAATSSSPVIKIVLPEDSLSNFDRGTVLRLELDRNWSSSAPASSLHPRAPYPWAPFVFQGEWQRSPGIDGDVDNDGLDGIFLPNGIPGCGGDERRGLHPAVWGDIGFLNTGNGEAPYVC